MADFEYEPQFDTGAEAHEVAGMLEPSWTCPECGGGFTEDPHRFKDHLMEDHGYDSSDASSLLHG